MWKIKKPEFVKEKINHLLSDLKLIRSFSEALCDWDKE